MSDMTNAPPSYPALMATIGGCLAAWSGVENGMGLAFNAISGMPNFIKAGAIFDAMVAFDVRLAVLDAAVKYDNKLSDDEKELWACFSRRLRKLYKRRHSVAHFSVVGDIENATSISPFFTWNKHLRNEVKSLTKKQIFDKSVAFSEASFAMSWFVNVFQRRAFPPEQRPDQLKEPALIAHLRDLIADKEEVPTSSTRRGG